MILSIITINRNNASGLEKTMRSVISQSCRCFEYVVVDGASTDESVAIIQRLAAEFATELIWVSEPDNGIYHAMNKGIQMASGEYIQFLNSGDILASEDVTERMLTELERRGKPPILYGNAIKVFPDGRMVVDKGFTGRDITLYWMFRGSLNHNTAYIKSVLFDKYGYYDESLKIVSDWKWFLMAIVLGNEKPVYTDVNMTVGDMIGISETNLPLRQEERQKVLHALIPDTILADYRNYSFQIDQMNRLHRHPWAYKITWFLDRCLFKWERCFNHMKQSMKV